MGGDRKSDCKLREYHPFMFRSQIPNFVESRQGCTADSWSFWIQHLAPVLLDGLVPSIYYKNTVRFLRFSELVCECWELEYRRDRVPGLKRVRARWVEDYER